MASEAPASRPAALAPYPSSARAWYAVAIAAATILLAFIDKQIIALVVDPIKVSLQVSDTQIGLLQGLAFSLFAAFAAVPLGRLVDAGNRRNLLVLTMLLWSVMTILCGLATSYAALFLFRMGVGLGEACIMPLLYSLLADCFEPKRRPTALLVFYLATVVCASLAVSLGGAAIGLLRDQAANLPPALAALEPWRLAFVIVGLPGPLLAAIILLTLREPARQGRLGAGGGLPLRRVAEEFGKRRPAYLRLVLGSGLALAAGNAVNAWYPTILIRGYGFDPADAGISYGLAAAASALVAVPIAAVAERMLRDRYPGILPRMLLVGVTISAVFALLLPLPANGRLGLALAASQLFGLYWIVSCTPILVQDITPNEMRGQILALATLVSTVLQGLSPVFVGLYSDRVFSGPLALVASLSATTLPLLLIAIMLYIRLPRAQHAARAGFAVEAT